MLLGKLVLKLRIRNAQTELNDMERCLAGRGLKLQYYMTLQFLRKSLEEFRIEQEEKLEKNIVLQKEHIECLEKLL